jgi:formate-dependent nitrite reductase membrane component NrfD
MGHASRAQNVFMDRWSLEPKTQRVWGGPHATWFTLMALGGGLFIMGRALGAQAGHGTLLGVPMADVISFTTIAIGGLILIGDLGRPLRFWRAFVNVRTSWIAWGAWSDLIFLIAGTVLVLPSVRLGDLQPFGGLPWDAAADTAVGRAIEIVAGLAAVVVMFYAGAVLARPRAIPFWHSVAIPLGFMVSGFAMAAATLLLLDVVYGGEVRDAHLWALAASSAATLAVTGYHLATNRDVPGKRDSLERLLRGSYRGAYVGGTLIVGHLLPAVIAVAAIAADALRTGAAVLSVLTIPGGFALRLLTLRVGIFPPVRQVTPVEAARAAERAARDGGSAAAEDVAGGARVP